MVIAIESERTMERSDKVRVVFVMRGMSLQWQELNKISISKLDVSVKVYIELCCYF